MTAILLTGGALAKKRFPSVLSGVPDAE